MWRRSEPARHPWNIDLAGCRTAVREVHTHALGMTLAISHVDTPAAAALLARAS
jgi:hypothetical protein